MKKTNIAFSVGAVILVFVLVGGGKYLWGGVVTTNSELANAAGTSYLQEEAAWVKSCCVLPSGAITLAPGGYINPYFANSAAQGLLRAGSKYYPTVKGYIQWYFNHLNKPDNLGVYGTVYDYDVVSGGEVSKGIYDSSDSYAASFLTLVRDYYDKTGDRTFIKKNLSNIKLVAKAIDSTMRPDGLTNAKANYEIAYLMDNVEVWKGYKDFAYLLGKLGDSSAQTYASKANTTRSSMESLLWDDVGGQYNWYLGGTTDFAKFYPDAMANMWPIIFGLPEAGARTQTLYQKFITNQPLWVTLGADAFPTVSITLAAVAAGDVSTAQQFEANMRAKFMPARLWPWNTNESGWYMKYKSQ